ncbi:MAG TPA: GNAT family N-acetyltransferase [Streptosporangiaceae bacterium]|nr:GNAT family N-acetyltransferase [Streptosporangiaceae bacterium]
MTELVLRPAEVGDLPGVLRADQHAAAGDAERIDFLTASIGRGECLVCVQDGEVAGFAVRRPAHFYGRDFVDLLAVHPARRRGGLGRALLREALARAGTTQVFTSTNTSNLPMRSLLAADGWTFSGELDGLDEADPELVFYARRPA